MLYPAELRGRGRDGPGQPRDFRMGAVSGANRPRNQGAGWVEHGIPTASIRQPGVAAGAQEPSRSWRYQASRLKGIALVDPSYGAAGSTNGGRRNA